MKRVQDKRIVLHMVLASLFIALGVVLPQALHVFGESSGMTFLPIHIPILIAGLLLGPLFGGIVGLIVPLLSAILTGMPAVPKLYFMIFELVPYGIFTGIFIRKFKLYPSLVLAMIIGRIIYAISLIFAVAILGLSFPFANSSAFILGITTGIPGILIQLLFIPVIYKIMNKMVM